MATTTTTTTATKDNGQPHSDLHALIGITRMLHHLSLKPWETTPERIHEILKAMLDRASRYQPGSRSDDALYAPYIAAYQPSKKAFISPHFRTRPSAQSVAHRIAQENFSRFKLKINPAITSRSTPTMLLPDNSIMIDQRQVIAKVSHWFLRTFIAFRRDVSIVGHALAPKFVLAASEYISSLSTEEPVDPEALKSGLQDRLNGIEISRKCDEWKDLNLWKADLIDLVVWFAKDDERILSEADYEGVFQFMGMNQANHNEGNET